MSAKIVERSQTMLSILDASSAKTGRPSVAQLQLGLVKVAPIPGEVGSNTMSHAELAVSICQYLVVERRPRLSILWPRWV